MTSLWQLAFRNLWVRKTRTFVTAMGILLGVGAMFAISVMGATSAQSLKDFFAQSSGRANLTITEVGTAGQGLARRTLTRVLATEGVVDAVGITRQRVTLLTADKSVGLSVLGIDPEADARLRKYKLSSGRMLTRQEKTHNILLVGNFAGKHGIALGDTVEVQLSNGNEAKFKVIGLLADEGAGHIESGSVGFLTREVADAVFARANRLDQIDIVVKPEIADSAAALDTFKQALQAQLGDKCIVSLPTATGESISQAISGLNMGLGFVGAISLFVGMLLIYNTFQMTVAERTREIGMLRSLGATRRQILSLMMAEALFFGILGTALGIGGGLLLSLPLVQLMSNMMGLALESFVVPLDGLVQAVGIGLVTTLVAAFLPAWSASRIAPTEALRVRSGGRERFLVRHGWKVGLVLIGLAVLDATRVVSLGEGPQFFIATFLGTILLLPSIILLLERVGRRALVLIYGEMGPLGSRNLARSRVRASLTVGVLMIGVVMTVAIGAMTASFRASIQAWVDAALAGDLIIASDAMREDVQRDLEEVEGVQAVTPQRLIYQTVSGVSNGNGFTSYSDTLLLVGVDVPTYRQVGAFQFVGGEDEEQALAEVDGGDAVLVSTTLRDRWKVKRGDSVWVRTARGLRDFTVAGVVATFWSGGQSLFISRRAIEKYFGDDRVSLFMVRKTSDVSSAELEARLKQEILRSNRVEIISGDEFRNTLQTQVSQVMVLFDAMVWIAIIVGALGVVNTMTMNVLERVREIGTLRSIGMARGQLARMILAEAGMMGAIGSLFGVGIALPVSFVMVQGMRQGSGFEMEYIFPGSAFWIGVAIALVISQLAALYPTWRAARINIIQAVKEE